MTNARHQLDAGLPLRKEPPGYCKRQGYQNPSICKLPPIQLPTTIFSRAPSDQTQSSEEKSYFTPLCKSSTLSHSAPLLKGIPPAHGLPLPQPLKSHQESLDPRPAACPGAEAELHPPPLTWQPVLSGDSCKIMSSQTQLSSSQASPDRPHTYKTQATKCLKGWLHTATKSSITESFCFPSCR